MTAGMPRSPASMLAASTLMVSAPIGSTLVVPLLAGHGGGDGCGVAGDADQPARLQVGVDELPGAALAEQAAIAQDAHLVGDPLHVGQDVAGEDDGPAAAHGGDRVEHLGSSSGSRAARRAPA